MTATKTDYCIRYRLIVMLLSICLLSIAGDALAQKTITGRVVGDDQQPLPGVTVAVKRKTVQTTTTNDGR